MHIVCYKHSIPHVSSSPHFSCFVIYIPLVINDNTAISPQSIGSMAHFSLQFIADGGHPLFTKSLESEQALSYLVYREGVCFCRLLTIFVSGLINRLRPHCHLTMVHFADFVVLFSVEDKSFNLSHTAPPYCHKHFHQLYT